MEIAGYLFNGRFYKSLDDLRGRTMSDDNQPQRLYTEKEVDAAYDKGMISMPKLSEEEQKEFVDKWVKSMKEQPMILSDSTRIYTEEELKEAYQAGQGSMYCGCYATADCTSFEEYLKELE